MHLCVALSLPTPGPDLLCEVCRAVIYRAVDHVALHSRRTGRENAVTESIDGACLTLKNYRFAELHMRRGCEKLMQDSEERIEADLYAGGEQSTSLCVEICKSVDPDAAATVWGPDDWVDGVKVRRSVYDTGEYVDSDTCEQ